MSAPSRRRSAETVATGAEAMPEGGTEGVDADRAAGWCGRRNADAGGRRAAAEARRAKAGGEVSGEPLAEPESSPQPGKRPQASDSAPGEKRQPRRCSPQAWPEPPRRDCAVGEGKRAPPGAVKCDRAAAHGENFVWKSKG